MSQLSPIDLQRLTDRQGLKEYVESDGNRKIFVVHLVRYQSQWQGDSRLLDPHAQVEFLVTVLRYWDPDLRTIIRRSVPTEEESRILEFYIYIAQYFFDFQQGFIR